MANFFDDLGVAIKKVAGDVQTEVTITAREQKLKEAFQKLGKLHFQAVRGGKTPEGEKFDAVMEEIRTLQKEIADLRNAKTPDAE